MLVHGEIHQQACIAHLVSVETSSLPGNGESP